MKWGAGEVLIVEKADQYGGSSSLSGGGVWIPCSDYARQAGATDDNLEEALSYLQSTIPAEASSEKMLRTFLENGPKMLRYMHERTAMRYVSLGQYPDYYNASEGSREGHRSMEPEQFNITKLANRGNDLRPTHPMMYMLGNVPHQSARRPYFDGPNERLDDVGGKAGVTILSRHTAATA